MINRITNGWNVVRVIYLLLGSVVIAQGVIEQQWFAIAFGIYFASMGLLNYGCAAGVCSTTPSHRQRTTPSVNSQDIQFEEIKNH